MGRRMARFEGRDAQLPTLLGKLPPSNPTIGLKARALVAFQKQGAWVVRVYDGANIPQEVTDLGRTVGIWRD